MIYFSHGSNSSLQEERSCRHLIRLTLSWIPQKTHESTSALWRSYYCYLNLSRKISRRYYTLRYRLSVNGNNFGLNMALMCLWSSITDIRDISRQNNGEQLLSGSRHRTSGLLMLL